VGWTSNNHGGGWVRISLVPWDWVNNQDEATLKENVMKVACYGHDTREGETKNGDCIHPCNGRPGCEYQSSKSYWWMIGSRKIIMDFTVRQFKF